MFYLYSGKKELNVARSQAFKMDANLSPLYLRILIYCPVGYICSTTGTNGAKLLNKPVVVCNILYPWENSATYCYTIYK